MEDRQFPDVAGFPDVTGLDSTLQIANQNMSQLIQAVNARFPAQSAVSSLLAVSNSTSGGTTVKTGSGFLMSVSVNTASTGPVGTIYDAASPATAASSNIMTRIPSSGTMTYGYPFTYGLTVQPSTSGPQVASVYYI